MILSLYAMDEPQLSRLRAMFPVEARLSATSDWSHFAHATARSSCGIIAITHFESDSLRQLAALARRHPQIPLIVVTQKDADNVRYLIGIPLHAVIWAGESPRSLLSAIDRVMTPTGLIAVAMTFRDAVQLPVPLRAALVRACTSEPPLRSVTDLALTVMLDRRTLWRHWHCACGAALPLRLEDFLHWILLLHAVSLKSTGRKWFEVATELHVHEHTLQRLAQRLGGMTCHELVAQGLTALTARFTREVVEPLLDPHDGGHSGAN